MTLENAMREAEVEQLTGWLCYLCTALLQDSGRYSIKACHFIRLQVLWKLLDVFNSKSYKFIGVCC